ncbi:MAG: toll/interleukin-1 receptor domain-containing protein [Bacteroidia bacterium]|jgi:hypothetical protein|nr:toll/interleukin-1 receptor domain-containing protein [Bacteroidia bacterium]
MGKKIFISYATEDIRFVRELESKLLEAKHEPWNYKSKMIGGQRWKEMEQLNLDLCDKVIVVISESVVNDVNRSREVWNEIRFSIKEAEKLPASHSFIIPVIISKVNLPEELSEYHAINYLEYGFAAILKAIEPEGRNISTNRIIRNCIYIFLAALSLYGAYYLLNKENINSPEQIKPSLSFTFIDKHNKKISNVSGFLVDKNSDTIPLENTSALPGIYRCKLDSFQRPFSLLFSHLDYSVVKLSDTVIGLTNTIKLENIPASSKSVVRHESITQNKRTFSIIGFELSDVQKKEIASKCGFIYTPKGEIVISYEYNRSRILCMDGGCRFLGDRPVLSGNGFSLSIGDSIPQSPDKPLSRNEIDRMIENSLYAIRMKYKNQLFEGVMELLCSNGE